MKRWPFPAAAGAALVATAFGAGGAARAADLAVTLTGVPDDRGRVVVGVCTKTEFLGPHCRFHASAKAMAGTDTLIVRDVAPGTYAVTAYQDVDGSGRLKTGFFGAPTEPVGFSRNPPLGMRKPRFADSAVTVTAGGGALTLAMRRY